MANPCEDSPEAPGEWLDYMDGDLSLEVELLAFGTEWRGMPPEVFVAALHGAPLDEQEMMMHAAFGQVASEFCCLFPEGADNWPGTAHSWQARMDSDGYGDIPTRAHHFGGLLIICSHNGKAVCSSVNRAPWERLARCDVSDARP